MGLQMANMHWKQSGLQCYPEIQDRRLCMEEYVIEASNCIDAANLDSEGVLNSWHTRKSIRV